MVKSVFKNKTEKKTFQIEIRFRSRGGVLEALRLHLTTWTDTGSLTVGPEGPLVRFDQSIPPLSLSRAEAGLRRSPPAIGGSVRETEVIYGFRGSRRSRRWVLRSREWTGSSAVSFAADGELREQSGFGATVVLDQNRVVGMVYGRMRGLLVDRTESGRPWWCRICRGSGGGCSCRR